MSVLYVLNDILYIIKKDILFYIVIMSKRFVYLEPKTKFKPFEIRFVQCIGQIIEIK